MALPPKPLAGMVEEAMGAGGPSSVDQGTEVQVPLFEEDELPPNVVMLGAEDEGLE